MATNMSFSFTKQNLMDTAERVAWTFVEAAGAVLLLTNQPLSKTTLIAAAAAGISAVKNLVKSNLSTGA